MAGMMIPPGFHFAPTDNELITGFLWRRSMGLPALPWYQLLEKNLYGENANPWDVFNDDVDDEYWETTLPSSESSKKVKKDIYVFTKLSKVNTGKKRISRTAGCGTWDGQTCGKEIYNDSGEEIGLMKMFSFKAAKKSSVSDDDHWIMHEYSLSGVSLKDELKYKDLVVCKITRILSREKFVLEEKEKRRVLNENIIMNNIELLGKKRSLFEEVLVQVDDDHHPTPDHNKYKINACEQQDVIGTSTALIATPEINDHDAINDGSLAGLLAPDFNLEDDHLEDFDFDFDFDFV